MMNFGMNNFFDLLLELYSVNKKENVVKVVMYIYIVILIYA